LIERVMKRARQEATPTRVRRRVRRTRR